MREYITLN